MYQNNSLRSYVYSVMILKKKDTLNCSTLLSKGIVLQFNSFCLMTFPMGPSQAKTAMRLI